MEERLRSEADPRADDLRRWAYLAAAYDPLSRIPPQPHPALDAPGLEQLKSVYLGPLAVEFMHLPYPDRVRFIADCMEAPTEPVDGAQLLDRLVRAELFEQVLQSHYAGTKRFSLEGMTALLPLLDETIRRAAQGGMTQVVLGMSHRGRLAVIVHLLGKPPREIFARFEDAAPESVLGSGDVKYHLGAVGSFEGIPVELVANPSHLEAVDPVVLGTARALEDRGAKVLPLLLHGDAAIAGQGVAAETFNLSELPGYQVGGTIHVVLNNLIGFTTAPRSLYSSALATDVARRLAIPIFHVSAEAPEAVVKAARIAALYRERYASDVVIDLVGYRRHGHSEIDDPTTTQPLLYKAIQALPPVWQSYGRSLGRSEEDLGAIAERCRAELDRELGAARSLGTVPSLWTPPTYWSEFTGGPYDPGAEVSTAIPAEVVRDLGGRLATLPSGFRVHPKVAQGYALRAQMAEGKRPIDWAAAEALAFASLLAEDIGVRLTGQDTRRGTFNQRHAVLVDTETEAEYVPLNHLRPDQTALLECIDSPLSEAAPLGFEYGYSRAFPERLVAWEAQFGDFANGAQIVIDQFLSSAEDKWGNPSGLVLLLPHGFEGQGPEHSHARPERFLQLAAHDAFQVCQPSTAAQYFHLLRRQMLRRWRKPLIVLTPKGLLRHPSAASPLEALTSGEFERVRVLESDPESTRILFCSGKILHELRAEREKRGARGTALVAIEEFYPFPERELGAALDRFPRATERVWIQEEPANMGAWSFLEPRLGNAKLISRPASGSPATGSAALHAREQAELLARAY